MTGCEVEEVYADGKVRGFPIFERYGDVDTAVATMRMVDGPLVVLTTARHDPLGYDIRAEVFGSKDSVAVGLGPRTPIHLLEPGAPPPAGPAWPDFLDRFEPAYAAEFRAFVDLVRHGGPSACTAGTASRRCGSPKPPTDRSTSTVRRIDRDPRLIRSDRHGPRRPNRKEVSPTGIDEPARAPAKPGSMDRREAATGRRGTRRRTIA
jgi:hypothetical protein